METRSNKYPYELLIRWRLADGKPRYTGAHYKEITVVEQVSIADDGTETVTLLTTQEGQAIAVSSLTEVRAILGRNAVLAQSAIADKDGEIAELKAEIDRVRDEKAKMQTEEIQRKLELDAAKTRAAQLQMRVTELEAQATIAQI